MIDKLKDLKWWITATIGLACAIVWLINLQVTAAENKKKVDKVEQAIVSIERNTEQTAKAFQEVKSREFGLWLFLTTRGVSDSLATEWSRIPIGPVVNADSIPIPGFRYYDVLEFPDMGITKRWKKAGPKVLDTLWNFKED